MEHNETFETIIEGIVNKQYVVVDDFFQLRK